MSISYLTSNSIYICYFEKSFDRFENFRIFRRTFTLSEHSSIGLNFFQKFENFKSL